MHAYQSVQITFSDECIHHAYPVTQESANNVTVTPNLFNAIAKTNNSVRKRTEYYILNQV
jgi:hypothetical protein